MAIESIYWCSIHESSWPPITVFGRCVVSMFQDADNPCSAEEMALIPAIDPLGALTEENTQHEAIQEMMDAAQREAQPDLDAIVESHKTPLRGHWAEKDTDG